MVKDMTSGSPMRLIFSFALPLLMGNLLQQTYSLVDAALVGQFLGMNALAGVGASSSVLFLILGFCNGLTGLCASQLFVGWSDIGFSGRCVQHAVQSYLAMDANTRRDLPRGKHLSSSYFHHHSYKPLLQPDFQHYTCFRR